ncbi:HCP-like protein [Macroventuria anomochaeta]|uniref:HCP-like protein n=1 Tax=Macroventuria anomochaeta TaxID=301207 RepID=A0ACB6RLC8_9PLEO|nr:HCP-like protein [Macroventuria anomochaeta]KAF2622740.1 HCP-like protein [Macroventuria anomochaeta]
MQLKDLLKKKDKIKDEGASGTPEKGPTLSPDVPEFQFFRTTTSTHEAIEPPSFPGDPTRSEAPLLSPKDTRGFGRFRRHSNVSSTGSQESNGRASEDGTGRPRSGTLSERLHFGRNKSASSVNVPDNLPDVGGAVVARNEEDEAKWEKRATVLVQGGPLGQSAPPTPTIEINDVMANMGMAPAGRSGVQRQPSTSALADEENIQKAIRLHENGNLEASTALFGRLADPSGANNALAQVLYGLALRHAWGIDANQEQAVHYLSLAASNSAEVEKLALGAGMKKGGAAKGELVLAMYELANCFRNGWGIKKDPAAAKQYYETAANLGDADAMNEVAWCYTEGFGTKKDKFKAAQFLRLAESKGNKTLGNTWIWKPKYDPK